ncbi:MAG: efflux RND transporter periplasmic adaptor subunit [Bacteroidales bacterium]|nr:efflux RND transporter periplasmic adaptor subunit [Bacteroidales bacterium]
MMQFKYFILIALSIAMIGCGKKTETKRQFDAPIPVEIDVMGASSNSNARNYVGTIKSEMTMSLSFSLGGVITGIYVHNGQKVKKGDLIAKVDETTAKSLHDAALASLNQAEDGYARLKQVHDEGGISDVRWVQMETDLEKARQTEISTRKHLDDCTIYAPQDGVISMEERTIGQQLSPMQPFCYLLDLNRLVVTFSVPEKEIGLITIGDAAVATIPSLNDTERSIVIANKALVSNPFGHTYTVSAKISPEEKDLLPGMVTKIKLTQTALAGIVVPSECVQTLTDGIGVWVVKGNKAERRKIEVSEYVKNGVLVTNGLAEGDTIVTVGYQKLWDGAKVSITY